MCCEEYVQCHRYAYGTNYKHTIIKSSSVDILKVAGKIEILIFKSQVRFYAFVEVLAHVTNLHMHLSTGLWNEIAGMTTKSALHVYKASIISKNMKTLK